MVALKTAAMAGAGVVQLPLLMLSEQLKAGALISVLPEWAPRRELIHLVYPSRRGMIPAVRVLIDFMATRYASMEED